MRQIKISKIESAEWDDWIKECKEATKENINNAKKGLKIEFSSLYKAKYIKDHYFFSENEPFYGKCVYCETPILDIFPGDVEHYRPKGKVTDDSYNVIYVRDENGNSLSDDDGKPIPHPGYYWLAYDWTNLFPSCTYCNRPKKDFGKRNCFPVIGQNQHKVGSEKLEDPLILNPINESENGNPEKHFTVDFDTGLLIHKTEKGRITIEILGLNKRDYLRQGRLQAVNEAKALLADFIYNPNNRKKTAELINIYSMKRTYSFAFTSYVKDYLRYKGLISI